MSDPSVPGLSGRIAVVTGASAGIGEAAARMLARDGASLVINARRAERLNALARELGASTRIVAIAGDAADQRVIDSMLDAARDELGGGSREADLVVVNAGRGLRGSAYDSDAAQWEEVIRINLLGAARLMRSAAQRMGGTVPIVQGPPQPPEPAAPLADWPAHPRDIVVLGSAAGRHISPLSSVYGSTKTAVHALAESLRRLLGPRGVRVTLLEPGVVQSEFQEAAGYHAASFTQYVESISPVLSPDDIARLVQFIVSQPPGMHICDVVVRPTRQEYP